MVRQNAHMQIDRAAGAGRDILAADAKCRPAVHQPLPLVLVRPGRAFFSRNSMILLATSTFVDCSMPSSPGEELTSITTGPWLARRRSTPQTLRPIDRAARIAALRSS